MSDDPRGRIVFSTEAKRVRSKRDTSVGSEPVPLRLVAKLRIEKQGRGGKVVTIVDGLPRDRAFLDDLARDLKRALGTGGAVVQSAVELQGDRRERLREILADKGFVVKG